MTSLAHAERFIGRKNYVTLLLVGVTLVIWGMLILSFVFIFKGIF